MVLKSQFIRTKKRHAVNEDLEKIIAEINGALEKLRPILIDCLNRIRPPGDLESAIQEFRKSLQGLNNRNTGIVLGVQTFTLALFPLSGDLTKDLGQKNESGADPKPPTDEDFLKALELRLPDDRDPNDRG